MNFQQEQNYSITSKKELKNMLNEAHSTNDQNELGGFCQIKTNRKMKKFIENSNEKGIDMIQSNKMAIWCKKAHDPLSYRLKLKDKLQQGKFKPK
jgi:hypothetical protein